LSPTRTLAGQLAEIGVMLLMFGVGLHFSVADLMAVRRVVLLGAVGQIMIATSIGLGLTLAWGWSVGAGVVLGLSLSVASTVVLLKALEERNAITTVRGAAVIMNPARPTAYRAVHEDLFGIDVYAVTDIWHEHYWLPPTYNGVMERRRTRQ
jgi:Kef-type K+ transport system membrane component KefB